MIRLYGASWCKPCKETKQFFDKQNIQYEYIDVDDKENQKDVDDKNITSIPYIEFYNDTDELINSFVGSITTQDEFNKYGQ